MTAPNPPDFIAGIEHIERLFGEGRFDLAAAQASALRTRFPRDAEAARLQAIALLQLGRIADARVALMQARELAPQSVEVLCNLGSVLLADGDAPGALAALEQAFALAPQHPAVLNGLGNARRAAGDLAAAREAYVLATRAMPDHFGAALNLAAADLALGDMALAEREVRAALAAAPGHPEGLLLLGHVFAAQRRYADAETAYAAGAHAAPRDARFAFQRGLMAEEQKHLADAATAYAQALALDPQFDRALGQRVFVRRQLCDWTGLDDLSTQLRARVAARAPGIAPFGFLAEPASAAEQRRCAQTQSEAIEAAAAPLRARLAFTHPRNTGPLRVGFVASGFGEHPTALLVVAMLEQLREHEDFEIHLFSTAPDDHGAMSRRLHAAAHAWHDAAGVTSAALARTIHAAGIEILLDLDGYCAGAMPETFALRPAPVQVNWLAYPGTLAAPWIDYVIADRIVLPESLRAQFGENVAWLPCCFQPTDTTREVAVPPPREACDLPSDGVVYACFNNSWKINPTSFERMLAVLRATSGSVLWLLSGPEGADARLRAEASRRDVDSARLVFAPKVAHAEYLARYRHADLFLDTAPYNAHTTASDAIWAGCPVLTIAGTTFASRVAASLNHHLGMPQLVADDDAAFVETAVRLGNDAAARTALRTNLAERRQSSGLFDMRGYARDFAALLRVMAQRHRGGLAPGPLE